MVAGMFSSIFPYPIFSNHTNITESNAYEINNHNETEISAQTKEESQLLPLKFEVVNALIPTETEFEVLDLKANFIFTAKRTGGVNHIDLEPTNEENAEILFEMLDSNYTWKRHPVLVKLNEMAYIPASLAGYPHGYHKIDNGLQGHFCLHFYNSKTNGTNEIDFQHQRCVNYAENNANLEEITS